jgi:DUF971 family protein
MIHPVELQKTEQRTLNIVWSDGTEHEIPFFALRKGCHCAHCNEERINPKPAPPPGQLNVLSAAEARPLDIEVMHPVGNYAYSIHFSDGHQAGIYTFELLREIGDAVKDATA